MAQKQDISQHIGATWIIPFFTFTSTNDILAMPAGTTVQFKIADPTGLSMLSIDTTSGVTITDQNGGAGSITITPAMQVTAGLTPRKSYNYELRVTTPSVVSVQAVGKFTILPSLFVAP